MMNHNHPFHLVTFSPWPLIISLSIFNNLICYINWFHNFYSPLLIMSISNILICMYLWRDVLRESTYQGFHSIYVFKGMKIGMILFIISEIFFISFFSAYFHSSLAPSIEQLWPPNGIIPFNLFDIPLMNTIILISSDLSVTWIHHALINIILGIYFSLLQVIEYINSPSTMIDSIYGSTFFIATDFHGIHVIIGTLFLFMCLIL